MTHLTTAFVLLMLAPSGGWTLTVDEISQFNARNVVEQNTGKKGSVTLVVDGDNLRLRSNGIPDHATGTFPGTDNPNSIKEQSNDVMIPNKPEHGEDSTCLPMGTTAYAKNGVAMYNPYNAFAQNAVEGDTAETFDNCEGHPSPDGQYHYHHNPKCLHEEKNDEFIGVALDGYPIYGWKDSSGKILTSADLDECNGHMVNGQYRYRLTKDLPYIMGCFKGKITLSERQKRRCYFISGDGGGSGGIVGSALVILTALLLSLNY